MTMIRHPEVSIIITNYNYGKFISRCLRSCLDQKNVNHEIIVVDDNSSDNSDEVIKPFLADKRVKYIKLERNAGVAAASNAGFKAARGMFAVRVDADDFINTDMCYFMRTYLIANNDAFCVSCDYYLVDNMENITKRKYAEKDNISCGIMYRKDLLLEMGGYNEDYRHREEEELRKRLKENYKIHHLKIPFYRYRMHSNNKTKTNEYMETEV